MDTRGEKTSFKSCIAYQYQLRDDDYAKAEWTMQIELIKLGSEAEILRFIYMKL